MLKGPSRAMSLASFWIDNGRGADGVALLEPIYDKFDEGFETGDLKAARQLGKIEKPIGFAVNLRSAMPIGGVACRIVQFS